MYLRSEEISICQFRNEISTTTTMQELLLPNKMKHLILRIDNGWIKYRMGGKQGMHPIGDDLAFETINYLVSIIKPESYEIEK